MAESEMKPDDDDNPSPADLDDQAAADAYDEAENKRLNIIPCVHYSAAEPECPCVFFDKACVCKDHTHIPKLPLPEFL